MLFTAARWALVLSAATIVEAHFVLQIPTSLGFDDSVEATGPCGSFNPTDRSTGVTNWPIAGAPIGILSTHTQVEWQIKAALVSDTTSWTDLVPHISQTGVGSFCFASVPGLAAWVGKPAVLQVIQIGGDGTLYQCAAIQFVAGGPASVPSDCTNSTGTSAKYIGGLPPPSSSSSSVVLSTTASSSSTASQTTTSSQSSTTSSSAASSATSSSAATSATSSTSQTTASASGAASSTSTLSKTSTTSAISGSSASLISSAVSSAQSSAVATSEATSASPTTAGAISSSAKTTAASSAAIPAGNASSATTSALSFTGGARSLSADIAVLLGGSLAALIAWGM